MTTATDAPVPARLLKQRGAQQKAPKSEVLLAQSASSGVCWAAVGKAAAIVAQSVAIAAQSPTNSLPPGGAPHFGPFSL